MRKTSDLAAGRRADAVDQADAILQLENLRLRAEALCAQQDGWFTDGRRFISWDEAALWMSRAWDLLAEVARG